MNRALRYSSKKVLLISFAIGILPIILGSFLVYLKTQSDLSRTSSNAAHEAFRQITVMLVEAQAAADELISLAGVPCPEVAKELREAVATYRFLRATNLAIDNQVYCSSLYGTDINMQISPSSYMRGRLRLVDHATPGPKTSVLVLRTQQGNKSVLVGIDGRHIQDALHLINKHSNLSLQVGNTWMTQHGVTHTPPFNDATTASKKQVSNEYGFTVQAAYPPGTLLRHTFETYSVLLGLLLVLGLFSAWFTYWMLGRVLAPSMELQRALSANEFIPYLQPVISSTSGTCVGCEVLIRWDHPHEGIITPNSFIPLAERSGLIIAMTRTIMHNTAQLLAPHAPGLVQPFHIGFNICAKHFESFELVDDCTAFLQAFKPGTIIIVLEMTERELIKPTPTALQLIEQLHGLGVQIALDDFGTGHSSLSYLQQFKVDYIKIDRSFVSMIGADALSVHILDSILDLALKLDLQVLAEGIETEEQRDYLGACGVDFMQGYFYARPMPVNDFLQTILQYPDFSKKNPWPGDQRSVAPFPAPAPQV